MLKTNYRKITINTGISKFFTDAFIKTSFMLMIACATGALARIFTLVFIKSAAALLGIVLLTLGGSFFINMGIHRAFRSSNLSLIKNLTFSNAALLGTTTGIITSIYRIDIIAQSLFLSCFIFGMSTAYGYYTKKDMSQLTPVLQCLAIACFVLGLIGLGGSFISRRFAHYIFSINSFLSIIYNIIFIVFFINTGKKVYMEYGSDKGRLQILVYYTAYSLFMRILDMFMSIVYLLGNSRSDD